MLYHAREQTIGSKTLSRECSIVLFFPRDLRGNPDPYRYCFASLYRVFEKKRKEKLKNSRLKIFIFDILTCPSRRLSFT